MRPIDYVWQALSEPENLASGIAVKTTWTGFYTSLAGLLSQINWVGLLGVLIALCGLLLQLWLGLRRDRRETRLLEAQLTKLGKGTDET